MRDSSKLRKASRGGYMHWTEEEWKSAGARKRIFIRKREGQRQNGAS